jgi:tetratricopeptide (TPR) repeat protein
MLGLLTGASRVERSALSGRWHVAPSLIAACLGLAVVSRWALADGWAARGAWLDVTGHHDEARAAFEHAQRYDPLTSRYPLEQGERLLKYSQGRPINETRSLLEQAQRVYERTVKRSPWLGYAWLRLGEVRWQLGERDAAIEAMETAVRRDPNSRAAAAHLARFLIPKGRFKELVKAGRTFQHLEPASPLGYFWEALGVQYVGAPQQTIVAYSRVVTLFPDYSPALFNLATFLRQRGAFAEAAHYYEAFLRVAPVTDQSTRHEARRFLSSRAKPLDAHGILWHSVNDN